MTTGSFAIANEGTFTWTPTAVVGGGGGEDLTVFKVGFRHVAWSEGRHHYLTVPAGYGLERYTLGVVWFRALLGGMYDKTGATLPTPGGFGVVPPNQPGTLEIDLTTTGGSGSTTRSKSVPGWLIKLDGRMTGGGVGPEQEFEYAFIASATGPTSMVTTT